MQINQQPDIEALALGINAIELNEHDLLQVSLESIRTFVRFNAKFEGMLDHLLGNGNFVHNALEITRESMVLGLHVHLLSKNVDFRELIPLCFNQESRVRFVNNSSENSETKVFFQQLFTYLAIEAFTSTSSRNKEIMKISSIAPEELKKRIDIFREMAEFE